MPQSKEGYLWTPSAATEGLVTDAVIPSSTKLKSAYDVVVIGSGFAGLVTARDLKWYKNLDVLIVEGRDRIGGRTWTAKALGEEFEMGETWVHWFQPHVYNELHRYNLHKNLKISAGSASPKQTYYKPANENLVELAADQTNAIIERVAKKFFEIDGMSSRELLPYPHDPFRKPTLWKKYDCLTVRQRLDQLDLPQTEKDLFEATVNTFGSGTGTETGFIEALRWYALAGHNMAQVFELAGVYKIGEGGMTSLARSILKDFDGDILFNTVVTRIENTAYGARLETAAGGEIKAKAVVSTIPLNCLSDICFYPPLNSLRSEAVARGHINQGAKIHFKIAETEKPWFATCNGYGNSPFLFAFSDHNGTRSSTPNGTYCIGFGYNGYLKDKKDSKYIVEEFRKNIRNGADIQAYLTHDWTSDPLAKGAWSCWGSNSMSRYLQELQKPHGNIVFASADLADGWRGFIDGAIESGQRAAREVSKLVAQKEYGEMSKL